ncbi:hypothetical protein Shyhy01_28830 [Streptomyces hygroscopicus subsp. hygroscopicus]|nr:hypothetical protein [Streptomyces hygroscopicus]GLX49933.1 hypothetical protein Shyhy01_28830 [Streptomyces hygroscopicus subsp. hygroscopicus]
MTPWLRLTHRCLRLLLVLTTALPVYGTTTAYAAEAGAPRFPTRGHPASASPSATSSAPPPGRTSGSGGASGHPADSGGPGHPGHDHQDRPGHDHAGADPQHPAPSGSASASYPPSSAEPSRAGSGAGEGKLRPGRPDGPWAEVEGDDDAVPDSAAAQPAEPETAETPTASPPTEEAGLDPTGSPGRSAARNAAGQSENASEPVLRILPLGSGLVLIGLGLGLAFLGLRLRRS